MQRIQSEKIYGSCGAVQRTESISKRYIDLSVMRFYGILAHRDYSNVYAAQFVIEKDRVYTKNSNLLHGHGELQLNKSWQRYYKCGIVLTQKKTGSKDIRILKIPGRVDRWKG